MHIEIVVFIDPRLGWTTGSLLHLAGKVYIRKEPDRFQADKEAAIQAADAYADELEALGHTVSVFIEDPSIEEAN